MNLSEADANFTPDMFDYTYLNMELEITINGDRPNCAKVINRLRDKDGLPIGKEHNNLILAARMYKVDYKGGYKALLAANVISENMFGQFSGE